MLNIRDAVYYTLSIVFHRRGARGRETLESPSEDGEYPSAVSKNRRVWVVQTRPGVRIIVRQRELLQYDATAAA